MKNIRTIGTHYFFDESPLNFWGNLSFNRIDRGIDYLVKNNFNSLFLLIPWGEFIGDEKDNFYVQDYCDKFYRYIVNSCSKKNIKLYIRLGYLWEARSVGSNTYERYRDFFIVDKHKESLKFLADYLFMVQRDGGPNIKYFFSWEDLYWPIFHNWRNQNQQQRIVLAEKSGFLDYIKLIKNDNLKLNSIPELNTEETLLFCQFYDAVIHNKFFEIVRSAGISIGFEYRVDSDHIFNKQIDGKDYAVYYHWNRSHYSINEKYIYFHQNFGGPMEKNLTAQQSFSQFQWSIRTYSPMYLHNEYPLIIDQFNYIDNTESDWAEAKQEQLENFFKLANNFSQRQNISIALWSAIDWTNNIIFNGSFSNGLLGWRISKNSDNEILQNDQSINLGLGESIEQTLNLSIPENEEFNLIIRAKSISKKSIISFHLSDLVHHFEIEEDLKEYKITLFGFNKSIVKFEIDYGQVKIFEIKLYQKIFSQGGQNIDGNNSLTHSNFLKIFGSTE